MSIKSIAQSAGLVALLFVIGCSKNDDGEEVVFDDTPYSLRTGDFPMPNLPGDNALTREGVQLGRMLFYEPMLSLNSSMSCASCHKQANAFTDTNRFSIGVHGLPGERQAMAVFNLAWNSNGFFWDGRAALLRDQSLMPIQDSLEMAETLDNVVAKLSASKKYRDQFVRAFDDEPINPTTISLALEQFMFSIVSVDSKYDRYERGEVALTESEERGRALFFAEYNPFFPEQSGADCAHCHSTRNFENDQFMNNGLNSDAQMADIGFEGTTGAASDRGKMKVTSLRNIEKTQPYMHDGRFQTLEEVIDHYNSGIQASSTLDVTLANTLQTGLMLTAQDKQDLVAFLKTLTDEELFTNEEYADPFN